MSFWDLSDNTAIADTTGEFETGGGDMTPIPGNTNVLAIADEAKWDDYEGDRYISLRWSVMAPEDYKNRKVFQKIRVEDSDTKKADKAKRMLAAIDANAGGKLLSSGKEPDDEMLTKCLVNKPMVLKLQVWKITEDRNTGEKLDEPKQGNWVSAVSPRKKGGGQEAAKAKPKAAPKKEESATPDPGVDEEMDDEIPF